jgi:hypothetical protein
MKVQKSFLFSATFMLITFASVSFVNAQGLLWSLPEDGTWVRYEGDYKETDLRPDAAEGALKIQWDRHVIIKSVGKETAKYEGKDVPCRWIEFKTLTGHTVEGAIDPGPAGQVIYKVLIPEIAITGKNTNLSDLPLAFVPVVKGFRKIGEHPVSKLNSGVLQIYPLISLLQQYDNIKEVAKEDLDLPLGSISANKQTASHKMERKESRSENQASFWRSTEVPFGLAAWTVKIVREEKESSDDRSAFEQKADVVVEMKAAEIGDGAQSELVTQ